MFLAKNILAILLLEYTSTALAIAITVKYMLANLVSLETLISLYLTLTLTIEVKLKFKIEENIMVKAMGMQLSLEVLSLAITILDTLEYTLANSRT